MPNGPEIVTGAAATGKTTYLLHKAGRIAAAGGRPVIVCASRQAAMAIQEQAPHGCISTTAMELAIEARNMLTGSIWGHEFETSWVSPARLVEIAKPLCKHRGMPAFYAERAVWFMVAADRNGWTDDWHTHLYIWFGAHEKGAVEIIRYLHDFMRANNIVLFPMAFRQITKAIEGYHGILGYTHVLADDAQSIPWSEYLFLESLAEPGNITIAIDPDKQVRSWGEGGCRDIAAEFMRRHPKAASRKLEQRKGQSWNLGIICEHLRTCGHRPLPGEVERLKLYQTNHESREAARIVRQVAKVREKYPDRSILVTFRLPRFGRAIMAHAVQEGLDADVRGYGDAGIAAALDLVADYLALADNPLNGVAFANAMNQPSRRLGVATWLDMNELREDRGVTNWLDLIDLVHEVKGIRQSTVKALEAFRTDILNLAVLAGREISDYLLDEIGLRGWLESKYGLDAATVASDALASASATAANARECLRNIEVARASGSTRKGIVIAPIGRVVGERFDYVWLSGVEHGIFPLEDDPTGYWTESGREVRDYQALYTIISRANRGVALWTAETRNLGGRWKRTVLSNMVEPFTDTVNAFERAQQKFRLAKPAMRPFPAVGAAAAA